MGDQIWKEGQEKIALVTIPVVSYFGLTVWAIESTTQLPLDLVCHPTDWVDKKGRVTKGQTGVTGTLKDLFRR